MGSNPTLSSKQTTSSVQTCLYLFFYLLGSLNAKTVSLVKVALQRKRKKEEKKEAKKRRKKEKEITRRVSNRRLDNINC